MFDLRIHRIAKNIVINQNFVVFLYSFNLV